MQTLRVNSNLGYIVGEKVIRGTVELHLGERSTAFELEVLNPGPESKNPPEARFSRDGLEVLTLIPGVTKKDDLDEMQRALVNVAGPMFDAGERVYQEAHQRLRGSFSRSKEILQASGVVEMGISRPYRAEGEIEDDVAAELRVLFGAPPS